MTLAIALTLIAPTAATAAKPHANPRVQTARTLNRALAATPMAGTGWKLEQTGHRWKIHPALIAAIAGTESSFGRVPCRNDRFNSYGLASCTNSWPVPRFRSWAHSFQFMGKFLSERWPRARTPFDYRGYAACSDCWGRKTAYWMKWLGFGSSVRYP